MSTTTLSLPSSDSVDDPQPPTPATPDSPCPYDRTSALDPKRRKTCSEAVEKVDELLIATHDANHPSFSFSFDTKLFSSAPEITPKFGSFNFGVSKPEEKEKAQVEKGRREEETDGEQQKETNED